MILQPKLTRRSFIGCLPSKGVKWVVHEHFHILPWIQELPNQHKSKIPHNNQQARKYHIFESNNYAFKSSDFCSQNLEEETNSCQENVLKNVAATAIGQIILISHLVDSPRFCKECSKRKTKPCQEKPLAGHTGKVCPCKAQWWRVDTKSDAWESHEESANADCD